MVAGSNPIASSLPLPATEKDLIRDPPSIATEVTMGPPVPLVLSILSSLSVNRFGMGMLDTKVIAADIGKVKAALQPGQLLIVSSAHSQSTCESRLCGELELRPSTSGPRNP